MKQSAKNQFATQSAKSPLPVNQAVGQLQFARYMLFYLLLLAVGGALLAFLLIRGTTHDKAFYHELVAKAAPVELLPDSYLETKQTRVGVKKTLWFSQGEERLLMRIEAAKSTLSLLNTDGRNEILEEMEDINCLMQESLYYYLPDGREGRLVGRGKVFFPAKGVKSSCLLNEDAVEISRFQSLRHFEAKHGLYDYKSTILSAEQVILLRFMAPGHILPHSLQGLDPIMKGIADSIQISLSRDRTDFSAKRLRMTFFSKKGML